VKRPLNMPGAVPTAVDYRTPAYWSRVDGHTPVKVAPVILEPTPAQIERGQRVLWVETSPSKSVRDFAELCRAHGFWAGISRSRYIDVPVVSGRLAGQRPTCENHVVRFDSQVRMLTGWACWRYTEELEEWKAEGGQVAQIVTWEPRAMLRPRTLGITELEIVIQGGWDEELEAERRKRAEQARERREKKAAAGKS
jgi:hypothetical protein